MIFMPKIAIKTEGDKVEFSLEIAKTEAKREKGLMYRNSMKKDHGMLFIFDKPEVVNFWMKHTHIALDMVFIGEDFKIVHIEKHTEPCPETALNCPLYSSEFPVKYVLEIDADLAREYGIMDGQSVEIDLG